MPRAASTIVLVAMILTIRFMPITPVPEIWKTSPCRSRPARSTRAADDRNTVTIGNDSKVALSATQRPDRARRRATSARRKLLLRRFRAGTGASTARSKSVLAQIGPVDLSGLLGEVHQCLGYATKYSEQAK